MKKIDQLTITLICKNYSLLCRPVNADMDAVGGPASAAIRA